MLFRHILLASHGTLGAIAAEDTALQICADNGMIDHLIVVPEFWQGMTGDDWLNNGVTRDQFRNYLQAELGREVDQQCERLHRKISASACTYSSLIQFGRPDQALLQCTKKQTYDLVVLGSPRPRRMSDLMALRSKMLTKQLMTAMQTAMLIAPHPK
ncbi:universal stress protein [Nitrosomonas marina]|uniref:Nucleotide-binding universal stress protein, UspA family n=1 Tax=Nitrosomonas marina TaxID=917 RepID=A0A1H8AJC7_9PROT|nr:universal stress protein [Nitrosomonas marina]SEM69938.1 hypothetical protein SAMN05216325_101141 [Nitrosomonas marina]